MMVPRGPARPRVLRMIVAAMLALMLGALAAAPAVQGQSGGGPQLLHFPMRWCVLQGAPASRRDPDGAVLERIRRGSSILARDMGITLRSPLNDTLADARAFPVIRDPRTSVGRPGDVVSPVYSTAEYSLVLQRCLNAWQRLQRQAAPGSDFGGAAYGPPAVIIRDFVTTSGRVDSGIWGYGFSASTNPDYCNAATAPVRRASGGSLMVVDSSDGSPSAELDRRLIAHEVGHILRLGHGNGVDDPGSANGRIDKFCDDSENPYIEPGSLMTATLRYEGVTSWQRRLPRNVLRRHPAAVQEQVFFAPRVKRSRYDFLQRIAYDGSRTVKRLLPPAAGPLRPLPALRSAGTRGTDLYDAIRERPGNRPLPRGADLRSVGITEDVFGDAAGDALPGDLPDESDVGDLSDESAVEGGPDGGFDISLVPDSLPFASGEQFGFVLIDVDGDEDTGGTPETVPGNPAPPWEGLAGAELLVRSSLANGKLDAEAWRWDGELDAWLVVDPPPAVEVTQRLSVSDDIAAETPDDTSARRDSIVISIPPGQVELSERFGMAAMIERRTGKGKVYRDGSPADPLKMGLAPLTMEPAQYPVCAVNRQKPTPGTVSPGELVTMELSGFGSSGAANVWLGDRVTPIDTVAYHELGCAWPWIAQVTVPFDAEPGVHVVQVQLGDSGLTADCGVIVGGADLPDFDAP